MNKHLFYIFSTNGTGTVPVLVRYLLDLFIRTGTVQGTYHSRMHTMCNSIDLHLEANKNIR